MSKSHHLKSVTFGIIAATLIATTATAHTHTGAKHHHHRYARTNHDPGSPNVPFRGASSETSTPAISPSVGSGTSEDGFTPEIADWSYSETQPAKKLADIVLNDFAGVPEEGPKAEIRRVASAFGLDAGLMFAICQIESDFNPHERTGSYIGLFQLSRNEFNRYGPTGGNILDARDNAIAAAAKLEDEEALFKLDTRHVPTDADLYLIHQQGLQGAAQHLSDPDRVAWQSMCSTDEGREKGEHWCKRAIWGNTLPVFKRIAGSVERLTSGEFVRMWANRLASFLGKPVLEQFVDNDESAEHGNTTKPHREDTGDAKEHHHHRVHHFAEHRRHFVRYAHHHRLHSYVVRA